MANLSAVSMIIIFFVGVIIALVIGYFIGSMTGRSGAKAAAREKQKHDELKSDVREHFRQTSAIMSRMAEDYREMHQHMAEGAEKLADLKDERLAAPTSPEQLSQNATKPDASPARSDDSASAVSGTQAGGKTNTGQAAQRASGDHGGTTVDKAGQPNQSRTGTKAGATQTGTESATDKTAPAGQADAKPKPATAAGESASAARSPSPARSTTDAQATAGATGAAPTTPGRTAATGQDNQQAEQSQAAASARQPASSGKSPQARHVPIGSGRK